MDSYEILQLQQSNWFDTHFKIAFGILGEHLETIGREFVWYDYWCLIKWEYKILDYVCPMLYVLC